MDTMVKLAIERMNEEVERLKATVKEQQLRISHLEKRQVQSQVIIPPEPQLKQDELLNNQQVKRILGIGKNSLLKLVEDGMLTMIRMNKRTVRFSRSSIMEYIDKKLRKESITQSS